MKNKLYNKLIIGSANLEQKYGINKNEIKIKEFEKIINFLLKKKESVYLDTSSEYKNAEKIIGDLNIKKLNIITKIKVKKKTKKSIENEIIQKVFNSKKIFKNNKIYALLIHNPECLLSSNGKIIFNYLEKLKNKKYFKKLGISVYDIKSLKKFTKLYNLDIVQLSYNIFDQRLDNKKILRNLKKRKIEIHARSIFLQGTLLRKKYNNLKNNLLKKKLIDWNKWLKGKKLQPIDVCVSNAILNKKINKIVVGFDNYFQFKRYLKIKIRKNDISFFNSNNKKIINPSLWH